MKARLFNANELSSKTNAKQIEVGKWYKFQVLANGEPYCGYGKVVSTEIDENGKVEVEKYFELPIYRPYATTKWFDRLPLAIK